MLHFKKIFLFWVFFLSAMGSRAQVGFNYFRTPVSNLNEWRSLLDNPSIGPFQNGAVEAGIQVLNYGFLEGNAMALKTGFFAVNLPRFLVWDITIGSTGQYFSSPYLTESEWNILIARHFWGMMTFGVGIGAYNRSYDQSSFDLIDYDDPVFSKGTSLWVPEFSAGITIIPIRNLTIAFSARNLNSPDISLLGSGIKMMPSFRLSLSYNLSGLSFMGGGDSDSRGQNAGAEGSVQIFNPRNGLLIAGLARGNAFIRGRVKVMDQFSLGYGFSMLQGKELAGAVMGNHELFFSYEFDELPGKVPQRTKIHHKSFPYFAIKSSSIDLVPQFVVYSPLTEMEAYDIKITRKVDDDISPEILKKLNHADIVEPDSSLFFGHKGPRLLPVKKKNANSEIIRKLYTDRYIESIETLAHNMEKHSRELYVISPPKQVQRAMSLGAYIRDSLIIKKDSLFVGMVADSQAFKKTDKDSLYIPRYDYMGLTFPGSIPLKIYRIGTKKVMLPWELIIEDKNGRIVRKYTPGKDGNTVIYWDGRMENGHTVDGGYYAYFIQWTEDGNIYESPRRYIYVRKYTRDIKVHISKNIQSKTLEADKVGLILSK